MTDADTDTDTDIDDGETDMSELAELVIDELDPGQTIGGKIVLSRRQVVAIAGGGLSLGALGTFGVSDAQAQSAVGTIGTASSPVDVEAAQINASQLGTSSSPVDVEAASVNAGSVNTDDLHGIYQASEIIGGLPSISEALDAANADAANDAEVWIVGDGTHIINYTSSLSDLTIRAFGGVTLGTNATFSFDADMSNVDFRGVHFGAPVRPDAPDNVDFHHCRFDDTLQYGQGGNDTATDCDILDCEFEADANIILNNDSESLTIKGEFNRSSNFDAVTTQSGTTHDGLKIHARFGQNVTGIDFTGCTVNQPDIHIVADNSGTQTNIDIKPFDGAITLLGKVASLTLLGGRDTDCRVDIEDSTKSGVVVELTEAGSYDSGDAVSHTIRGHISGCNQAGVLCKGATRLNLAGLTVKQNSQASAGTFSGIQFDEIDIDGTTYSSKNNIVTGVQGYDSQGTKTQKFAVEDIGSSDFNHVTSGIVVPNETGATSLNTNSTTDVQTNSG